MTERLRSLNLLNHDGSYCHKLNETIINFKDKLWSSEIDYLAKLLNDRKPIPTKFMSRLIRLRHSDPMLNIIVQNLIHNYNIF